MKQKDNKINCAILNKMSVSQTLKLQVWIFIQFAFIFFSIFSVQAQFTQRNKLTGTGNVGSSGQGSSVSISSDGNIAIVGGPNDNSGAGAAWIYEKDNLGNWIQFSPKLVGTGALGNARQGHSVAISGNGNYAIVGGPYDDDGVGAVWFFRRDNAASWIQEAKLTGPVLQGEVHYQGYSVSLNHDGDIAIVGGPRHENGLGFGSVWTFARTGNTWAQLGNTMPYSPYVEESFGHSVSLSADGNTAVIGNNTGDLDGKAVLFTRSNAIWTRDLTAVFSASNPNSNSAILMGNSVAISSDASTVLVGAPGYTGQGNDVIGAVFVFTNQGGSWGRRDIVGTDILGYSVSVSGDGNTAMLGGGGGAYIYKRTLGAWSQVGNKLVGTGAIGNASQGASVSISAYSCILIMGGPKDNAGVGAAWIFTCDYPLPVELSSFVSNISGNDVKLNWTTSHETNNSGFSIERKDAVREWASVGFVTGTGNSSTPVSYNFTDMGLASGSYNYRLKQIDFNGNFEYFNLSNEVNVGIPEKFSLSQNYPNPFNPITRIDYGLPFDSKVSLKIFDLLGREVNTLVNDNLTVGYYSVDFNASNLASGMYFYRMTAEGNDGQFVMTRKMTVLK